MRLFAIHPKEEVPYVGRDVIKRRRSSSLAQNFFLCQCEQNVSDKQIDGMTRKQIPAIFEEERPYLSTGLITTPELSPCGASAVATSPDRASVNKPAFLQALT
jgi:hypothetical protein